MDNIYKTGQKHEVTLVQQTIDSVYTDVKPKILVGDKAYDSDPLDEELSADEIELIAPHRKKRKKKQTQDGRKLRRYKRRWKIERVFAWFSNYRRIIVRWDYHVENFLGFVLLACILILLRKYL
jgi:transposase